MIEYKILAVAKDREPVPRYYSTEYESLSNIALFVIGKCMAALLNGLSDRNTTVRKSYSTCLANICKVAKDSSVEKLVSRLNTWYMEKDGMYLFVHVHCICVCYFQHFKFLFTLERYLTWYSCSRVYGLTV